MCRAEMAWRLPLDRLVGLAFVLALHAAALYGLWQHRLIPSPQEAMTLFVNFIAPPAPEKKEEPKLPPPKPKPIEKPQPRQIIAETRVIVPTDYVAPPPPEKSSPEPVIQAPPMPLPPGPMALSSELSVACPERSAPLIRLSPAALVRPVWLFCVSSWANPEMWLWRGLTAAVVILASTRRPWLLCVPGVVPRLPATVSPVRAVALQPFNFILNGN
jgi:protein TonB